MIMILEIKTFVANKKNLIVCGLLVLVLAMFSTNFKQDFQYQLTLDSLDKDITRLEIDLKNNATDTEFQAFNQKQLSIISAEKNAFVNKDYQTYWEKKLEATGDISEDVKEQNLDFYQMAKGQKDYYDYLKKHKLSFPMSEIVYEGAFEKTSLTFVSFTTVVTLSLLVILFGDFFTQKFESERIRYYRLIRQAKSHTLLNHLILPFLIGLGLLLLTIIANYLVLGITSGNWGSFIYPYGQLRQVITPYWEIDLWALGFLILTLLFIITLSQLLSVIFKKTLVVVGVELLLIVGYDFLHQKDFFKPFIKFLPFEYLFGVSIVFPDEKYLFGANSMLIGAGYLLICSVIFYLLTNILYQKWIYRTK